MNYICKLIIVALLLSACSKEERQSTNEIIVLEKKVRNGDTEAQYKLANINYIHSKFLDARELYDAAAIKNHKKSQLILATMYAEGKGGKKDNIRSYFWSAIAYGDGATLEDADDSKELNRTVFDKLNLTQQLRAKNLVKDCTEIKFNLKECVKNEKYTFSVLPIAP